MLKNPGAFEKFDPHQIEWFGCHLEHNFEEIPDLVSEFEYIIKLGCKRQNAGAFEKFDPHQIEWFRYHLKHNFEEIPDLVSEFEYLIRLDHKRQNTTKIWCS